MAFYKTVTTFHNNQCISRFALSFLYDYILCYTGTGECFSDSEYLDSGYHSCIHVITFYVIQVPVYAILTASV